VSDEDRTKAELQDELRDRDLPVSGTKQELLDRLAEADDDTADDEPTTNEEAISEDPNAGGASAKKGMKPLQLARMAARQLEQVSGRKVDGVTGIEQAEGGWRVGLDLVETVRIPPATDVIGAYEVVVDSDGDLVRYERIRRYIRGQAGDDQ
jgi:hypothetical protein